MGTIRGVVVTPDAPARLAIGTVEMPVPAASAALVRVAAISLNRGEVNRAQNAPAGTPIGWDLAGTIEQAAADGSGPPVGTRVVGFLPSGAWAEVVAVPTHALAPLPHEVTFAQAATLPVAGLTALFGLEKAGGLLGRRVLVTGASGGVGDFAMQLAREAGAHVVALVRSDERAGRASEIGASVVAIGEDASAAAEYGPYDLVIDGVGGPVLASALPLLDKDGLAVAYGRTVGQNITFDLGQFFGKGGLRLYGFILFHEVVRQPAGAGLARLAALIDAGRLHPHISVEKHWTEIGTVAQQLLDRAYPGKAVLHVD
ncbi:MAG: zinc-binding dehydrogenase [Chloroflexi bacterium]|nr:zinc-binding dehydrogenase [Chloroflexota bacterium]